MNKFGSSKRMRKVGACGYLVLNKNWIIDSEDVIISIVKGIMNIVEYLVDPR
jgi:hypothetical protein